MSYATVEQLAEALNMARALTEEEVERAERCLAASSAEVDAAIGWLGEPEPGLWGDAEAALVESVALLRSVEWWKANDAAFGLIGSSELGALRMPRDGFFRHYLTLVPVIERFAIA